MAFQKDIVSSTMSTATYHRVTSARIDWRNKLLAVVVASFLSKEAREKNAGCLERYEFTYQHEEFPFDDKAAAVCEQLNIGDAQKLLNVNLTFDAGVVHGVATVQETIFGKPVTSEKQFQAPKAELVDYLAGTYTLVSDEMPFSDAVEV